MFDMSSGWDSVRSLVEQPIKRCPGIEDRDSALLRSILPIRILETRQAKSKTKGFLWPAESDDAFHGPLTKVVFHVEM